MYYQTRHTRKQLDIDTISTAVTRMNEHLHEHAFDWYAYKYVFRKQIHGYAVNRSTKDSYLKVVNSTFWIQLHKAKYAEGEWENPEWKVFHQCVKLSCLGASDKEINSWLGNCTKNGLKIPDTVGVNRWRSYLVWLIPKVINHEDIDVEAKKAMLKTVLLALHQLMNITPTNSQQMLSLEVNIERPNTIRGEVVALLKIQKL